MYVLDVPWSYGLKISDEVMLEKFRTVIKILRHLDLSYRIVVVENFDENHFVFEDTSRRLDSRVNVPRSEVISPLVA